jgi:LysR family nitrogen assimilation transcriptional regulator
MDLEKIQYFFAVMEHLNLSSAARALRVSQPTLSRKILALEEQFHVALFVRSGRGLVPTDAGKRLQEGLQGLERQLLALKDDVASTAVDPTGEVAFGIPPSPRSIIALPLIERYARAYPSVTVRVIEGTSGELRDQVANGSLDLAVTNINEPMHGVIAQALGQEPMLLIGTRAARLSMSKPVSISMLAGLPLILTTRPNSLRLAVEAGLGAHGLRPDVRFEVNALPLATDLVMAGLGYTVLPACGVSHLLKSRLLSACPVNGLTITWLVARLKGRKLSVAADRLHLMLQRIAAERVADSTWQAVRSSDVAAQPASAPAPLTVAP